MSKNSSDITIAQAVGELRKQILEAQTVGDGQDLAFDINEIEIELHGGFTAETAGEVQGGVEFKVFGLELGKVEAGGSHTRTRENSQAIRLKLSVRNKNGNAAKPISGERTDLF